VWRWLKAMYLLEYTFVLVMLARHSDSLRDGDRTRARAVPASRGALELATRIENYAIKYERRGPLLAAADTPVERRMSVRCTGSGRLPIS